MHTQEWRSTVLPRYGPSTRQVEVLIAAAYLSGTNTRRVQRALAVLSLPLPRRGRSWRNVKITTEEIKRPRMRRPTDGDREFESTSLQRRVRLLRLRRIVEALAFSTIRHIRILTVRRCSPPEGIAQPGPQKPMPARELAEQRGDPRQMFMSVYGLWQSAKPMRLLTAQPA